MTDQPNNDSTYELYTRGMDLLENGDFAAAAVPLGKVAAREPEKTSVREALGRALFRSRRFGEAAAEFEAVVERYPTNDYAHFCLGRSLTLSGRRGPGPPAPGDRREPAPRPRDYRAYRQRAASLLTTAACGRSSSGSSSASVDVDGARVARIGPGMLVLLGVAVGDDPRGGGADRRASSRRCGSSRTPRAA